MFKEYFHHADNLPPKEKALEKTRMLLEIILVIMFVLELIGIVPAIIANYIIAPALAMYAIFFAVMNFKKTALLSIMMIVIAIFVIGYFMMGLFA